MKRSSMQSTRYILALLCIISIVTKDAIASDWLHALNNKTTDIYIDLESIRPETDSIAECWVKYKLRKPIKKSGIHSVSEELDFYRINRLDNTFAVKSFSLTSPNGNCVKSYTCPPILLEYESIPPDSIIESIKNIVFAYLSMHNKQPE